MSYQFVLAETDGFVARLTLNRPDVLNSFNRQMAQELRAALGAAEQDRSVRVVLLTGAGRAFCAGQDLAEATPPPGQEPDLGAIVRESFNPVIRAIRGI